MWTWFSCMSQGFLCTYSESCVHIIYRQQNKFKLHVYGGSSLTTWRESMQSHPTWCLSHRRLIWPLWTFFFQYSLILFKGVRTFRYHVYFDEYQSRLDVLSNMTSHSCNFLNSTVWRHPLFKPNHRILCGSMYDNEHFHFNEKMCIKKSIKISTFFITNVNMYEDYIVPLLFVFL